MSLMAFLGVCWVLVTQSANASWSESMVYFWLTYVVLSKYVAKRGMDTLSVVSAIVIGRIILELPVRLLDWAASFGSLIYLVSSLMGIALATMCFKNRNASIFFLSLVILIIFNSFVIDAWVSFARIRMGLQ